MNKKSDDFHMMKDVWGGGEFQKYMRNNKTIPLIDFCHVILVEFSWKILQ